MHCKFSRIYSVILFSLFLLIPTLFISSCGGGGAADKVKTLQTPGFETEWDFITGQSIMSSPALASDGTLYIGSDDSYLYAFDKDGTFSVEVPNTREGFFLPRCRTRWNHLCWKPG